MICQLHLISHWIKILAFIMIKSIGHSLTFDKELYLFLLVQSFDKISNVLFIHLVDYITSHSVLMKNKTRKLVSSIVLVFSDD